MPRTVKGKTQKLNNPLFAIAPREELVLLALYDSELYGLEVIKAINTASEGRYKMAIGTIYPTLVSLRDKKMVKERIMDRRKQKSGGGVRVYYSLTPKGRKVIDEIQKFREILQSMKPEED